MTILSKLIVTPSPNVNGQECTSPSSVMESAMTAWVGATTQKFAVGMVETAAKTL